MTGFEIIGTILFEIIGTILWVLGIALVKKDQIGLMLMLGALLLLI